MGFPLTRVDLATNANRPIPDLFDTGRFEPRPTVATSANAMDVGAPSNVERIVDRFAEPTELRAVAAAASTDDARIAAVLREAHTRWGQVLCPHTATAVDRRWATPDGDAVLVATAHPAKFETIVEPQIGHAIALPPALAELMERPTHATPIGATLADLQAAWTAAE